MRFVENDIRRRMAVEGGWTGEAVAEIEPSPGVRLRVPTLKDGTPLVSRTTFESIPVHRDAFLTVQAYERQLLADEKRKKAIAAQGRLIDELTFKKAVESLKPFEWFGWRFEPIPHDHPTWASWARAGFTDIAPTVDGKGWWAHPPARVKLPPEATAKSAPGWTPRIAGPWPEDMVVTAWAAETKFNPFEETR